MISPIKDDVIVIHPLDALLYRYCDLTGLYLLVSRASSCATFNAAKSVDALRTNIPGRKRIKKNRFTYRFFPTGAALVANNKSTRACG